MVVGREDPFCSARASEKAHLDIKGSELAILEGCGHFPWIEKRDELMDVVSRFVE